MIKFDVLNRFTGAVKFTAEIDCSEDELRSIKLGLAVRWARKNKADLYRADLSGADISGADLSRANLSGADLSRANLYRADISRANLYRANLSGANLYRADISRANLYRADISRADISGANLSGANLSGANLSGAANAALVIAKTRILPEGDLIGWKKCKYGVMVKLSIPARAKRSHAFGRKCRAEFVDVLEVEGAEFGVSRHDDMTEYRKGERVICDEFEDDWQKECAGGIHFFITREEAKAW